VDDERNLHLAELEKVTGREICARIMESTPNMLSRTRLTVIQGIPRLTKVDLIAQKLTELGADAIIFVPMEYTPYTDAFERISKRLPRLRRIVEAAAKQCSRHEIPDVFAYADLNTAVKDFASGTVLLMADEAAPTGSLHDCLAGAGENPRVGVVIGPEGGFSAGERRMLENMGAAGFSLGGNILRTETAAIVATAIILYELGDI
jgi:16S rRNA (uracil1498-N3)-methyltransferase